jgi:hypothetical protein
MDGDEKVASHPGHAADVRKGCADRWSYAQDFGPAEHGQSDQAFDQDGRFSPRAPLATHTEGSDADPF